MLPTLLNAKLKFRASTTAKSNRPVAEFMDHFNKVKQCNTEQYRNNCNALRAGLLATLAQEMMTSSLPPCSSMHPLLGPCALFEAL